MDFANFPPKDDDAIHEEGQRLLILSRDSPLDSARRLIDRQYMHLGIRTIHHQQGYFYVWCGTHYREVKHEEIRATVYDFLEKSMRYKTAAELVPFNPSKKRVLDVVDAAAAAAQLPGTVTAPTWLDNEQRHAALDMLACRNGMLHLPTRTLLPHTPAFFGLTAVDYCFDPHANKPTNWLGFLNTIWGDDQGSIEALQELFGLLLTQNTMHQKAFMLVGPPRTGKGTIGRVLTALLGREHVAAPTLSSLSENFGLAPMIGKPLAIISDARLGGRPDVHVIAERILSITGEDSISKDRKYREVWTGQLPTRILILTNELPRLTNVSGALASRFIVWRLIESFLGREDPAMTSKILPELPGILLWAMDGLDRLAKRGYFVQPGSAKQATEELADLASPIGAFLRDRCNVGASHSVACEKLYATWTRWCAEQHRDRPGTVQTFGRDLRAVVPGLVVIHPRDARTDDRVRHYQGVGLAPR